MVPLLLYSHWLLRVGCLLLVARLCTHFCGNFFHGVCLKPVSEAEALVHHDFTSGNCRSSVFDFGGRQTRGVKGDHRIAGSSNLLLRVLVCQPSQHLFALRVRVPVAPQQADLHVHIHHRLLVEVLVRDGVLFAYWFHARVR